MLFLFGQLHKEKPTAIDPKGHQNRIQYERSAAKMFKAAQEQSPRRVHRAARALQGTERTPLGNTLGGVNALQGWELRGLSFEFNTLRAQTSMLLLCIYLN